MINLLWIETYKISRRPRTYIAFAAIAAIVLVFQFAFLADGQSYMNLMLQHIQDDFEIDKQMAINGYFMCYIILNTLLVQMPILVALVAGDAISGEANMGTLRLILTKPVSRSELLFAKFLASLFFTLILLIWMAFFSLFLSMWMFGVDDLLVFRVSGTESMILQISETDVLWRYFAAFGYATLALTVVSALAILFSVFADNSIGPIVASVCVVLFFTIVSNLNIPLIDQYVKPYLFTSYLVGWKGFFYVATDSDGLPISGTMENWPAVRQSMLVLFAHIVLFFGAALYFFNKKDILS
jgi:ABC-2 type transport system permease protein